MINSIKLAELINLYCVSKVYNHFYTLTASKTQYSLSTGCRFDFTTIYITLQIKSLITQFVQRALSHSV